jgi:cell wall assembly regulator SMI1
LRQVERYIAELEKLSQEFPNSFRNSIGKQKGATAVEIAAVEQETGIKFDDVLKSLWMYSNGSDRNPWIGVHSDENTACEFIPISKALSNSTRWNSLADKWGGPGMPDNDQRDERIKPNWQKKWFPFAEFNGGSTMVMFDASPSPKGKYGQIIVYQHDPDGIYYVAESTAAFLELSLAVLREILPELEGI